ncbi:hypothetical protein ACJJIW_19325 [Microbulbifer sp. JMSA004]|uniref:hypothetical protein n=1 Tax=Microbulbifer sp. JMSA004 TaxID=3243370 RepID=UPI00403A34EC
MAACKLSMREELERRYTELRRQLIQTANEALDLPDTRLALVDSASCAAFRHWENHSNRKVDWD